MPVSINYHSWKHYHLKASSGLEIITFTLSAITMFIAMVDNNLSMKLFNICGILALLTLLVRANNANFNWKSGILPISILLIGIIDVTWYSLFKVDDSPFRATYHNYLNTARVFIFGAFIVFLAATTKIKIRNNAFFFLLYIIAFFILGFAINQKIVTAAERVDFGIGSSTGTAYSIMLVGLISAISAFYTKRNHPLLFILNAVIVLAAISMTQTRSSMLIFPVICCIAIVINYNKAPGKIFLAICAFLTMLIVISLIFSKSIVERYEVALQDIKLYQQENQSNSSLGARLAMYEVGAILFQDDPLKWRSAEERAESTMEMIAHNEKLAVTTGFLNMHLHNEIIEASSLKGIIGIAATLFFYIALLFSAYSLRSVGLLVFSLAIIGTGLSDVILWARSIPIIIICGLSLLLTLYKEQNTEPA